MCTRVRNLEGHLCEHDLPESLGVAQQLSCAGVNVAKDSFLRQPAVRRVYPGVTIFTCRVIFSAFDNGVKGC